MNRENKRKTFEKGYYRTHACSDSFTCRVCGRLVTPQSAGTDHRNHCPNCLSSLHVDIEPGDRASDCGRPETAAHGKLVCLQCGATRPLECHMLDELSQHLEGAHGFRIEPSRTVLYGLCAKCADGIDHSEHSCKGGCCHEH